MFYIEILNSDAALALSLSLSLLLFFFFLISFLPSLPVNPSHLLSICCLHINIIYKFSSTFACLSRCLWLFCASTRMWVYKLTFLGFGSGFSLSILKKCLFLLWSKLGQCIFLSPHPQSLYMRAHTHTHAHTHSDPLLYIAIRGWGWKNKNCHSATYSS